MLGGILTRLFGHRQPEIPPPPPPPPDKHVPSDDDVRWARLQRDAIVRRAKALDIEVEYEGYSR